MRKIVIAILVLLGSLQAFGQVTIGRGEKPAQAAILDLKTEPIDETSTALEISSKSGGLLLPRVALESPTSLRPFIADAELTTELKVQHAGLTVYNIAVVGNPLNPSLYPALYTWDGSKWTTSQANEAHAGISTQPKAFSFYELGTEDKDTMEELVFEVSSEETVNYQWYEITGSNVHVPVGSPVTVANNNGAKTSRFRPKHVIKGTTRNARFNGFYKFYCEGITTTTNQKFRSDVVEVAVGCGAKNNLGEWLSFMCFNLGADNNSTIESQMNFTLPNLGLQDGAGIHTYVSGEENLYGDSYQWGRIADGHQKRNAASVAIGALATTDVTNGFYCTRNASSVYSGNPYPYQQVKSTSTTWYGKFIHGRANWYPDASNSAADLLWRTGRFISNDPCAKYKEDGTMVPSWTVADVPNTPNASSSDAACKESGTAWRTPTQEDWGAIYKGGLTSGSPSVATANSWKWKGRSNVNTSGGYQIQPNGATTTLFLPASGGRYYGSGLLYAQSAIGYYWSSSVAGTNAYYLYFYGSNVNPALSNYRAFGFALRCIKQE